jgi:hypothetical protein
MRPSSARSAATATGTSTRPVSPSSVITVSSIPRRPVMILSTGLKKALRSVSQALISGTNRSNARRAPDASTHRMMELWLTCERADKRVDLAGPHPVEVGHGLCRSSIGGVTANAVQH